MVKSFSYPALWLWAISHPAHAAENAAPNPLSAANVLQVVLGLACVLAIFGCAVWLMKRLNALPRANNHVLRVISGVAIGARERVVVIEIKDTWLVVGVAPGHVSTLHLLPRAPREEAAPAAAGFKARLKQVLERRQHG